MKDLLVDIYLKNSLLINILVILTVICAIVMFLVFKDKIISIYKNNKEIINYIIVGALTTLVSILSYYLFRFIIKNYVILSIISWICAVSFAYITKNVILGVETITYPSLLTIFFNCRI